MPTGARSRQYAAPAGGVSLNCGDPVHVFGPLEVSRTRRLKRENQSTRTANKTNTADKTATSNKSNAAKNTNKKPVVRLTNKQRIESKLLNLTLDVHGLQEELRSLEMYRNILRARVLLKPEAADGSIVQTAQQYFHVFQRGYRVTDAVAQFAYLQAVTDDALSMGTTGLGRAMLFEQWRRYSDYFAFLYISPPVIRVITTDADATCIVRCDTNLNGSFTWQALEMVFPVAKRDPHLMHQLLGREMVTPMRFHLHFDRRGRIVRHDFEADFFEALVHALKDPVKAAEIVENAKVAEEGMVDAVVDATATGMQPGGTTKERSAVATKARAKGRRRRREAQSDETRRPQVVYAEERHSVSYLLS